MFGDSHFTTVSHTKRGISLVCSVVADSKLALQSNLDDIRRILNPLLADKVFTFDDFANRRYVGRVVSMSAPTAKGRWGVVFNIDLVTLAYTQALTETNASASIATDPDTLTISAVAGSASRIPCEFYIRNETAGTITNTITLTNDTTGEAISWTGTLQDDKWLRFGSLGTDGRFSSVIQISDSTGADPEAETYFGVESGYNSGDWPRLKGGVDNSITVTGVSTGTLEWTYRGRYI
jgi:hypothetical protein